MKHFLINFIEVIKYTYNAFIYSWKMNCGSDGCKMHQRIEHLNNLTRYNDGGSTSK